MRSSVLLRIRFAIPYSCPWGCFWGAETALALVLDTIEKLCLKVHDHELAIVLSAAGL